MKKYWLYMLSVVLVFGLTLIIKSVELLRSAKLSGLVSQLSTISVKLEQYRREKGAYPDGGLAALGFSTKYIQDPFTSECFIYQPDVADVNAPIVEQATEFRVGLWPYAKKRKYGIYRDGSVRDILRNETSLEPDTIIGGPPWHPTTVRDDVKKSDP